MSTSFNHVLHFLPISLFLGSSRKLKEYGLPLAPVVYSFLRIMMSKLLREAVDIDEPLDEVRVRRDVPKGVNTA